MNCIIPFTKDIKFNTSIAEVSSISLEHDYTVNEGELLGNFTVSGEYKTHEVSVNKEKFEYVLPFSVSLTTPIDVNTVDFDIEDFTYEILDNESLRVDIEYQVKAQELEVREEIFEPVEEDEESIEDLIDEMAVVEEDDSEEAEDDRNEFAELEVAVEEKIENMEEEKNMIVDSANLGEDTYVTYQIHIMKENENIETVCSLYKTSIDMLENYNDLSSIVAGDKIVIPEADE